MAAAAAKNVLDNVYNVVKVLPNKFIILKKYCVKEKLAEIKDFGIKINFCACFHINFMNNVKEKGVCYKFWYIFQNIFLNYYNIHFSTQKV